MWGKSHKKSTTCIVRETGVRGARKLFEWPPNSIRAISNHKSDVHSVWKPRQARFLAKKLKICAKYHSNLPQSLIIGEYNVLSKFWSTKIYKKFVSWRKIVEWKSISAFFLQHSIMNGEITWKRALDKGRSEMVCPASRLAWLRLFEALNPVLQ